MAESSRQEFTSLVVYRNLRHRYSLFYPEEWRWHEESQTEGQRVLFTPVPEEDGSFLLIEARDLGVAVTSDDLPTLRRGFRAGLRRLPGLRLDHYEDYVIGPLIGLEARYRLRDGHLHRQRWTRLLYQEATQVCLMAQGATPERFARWLPVFTTMMHTFRFGDWWAEVTGRDWLPSLVALDRPTSPDR